MENREHDPMIYGPHLEELHTPEKVKPTNPWVGIAMPRLDTAIEEATPKPEVLNPFLDKKEPLVEQAALTIGFDKEKLTQLELPGHLEHLRKTLLRLPERLEFQPGVTLIFGPNGSGKSTLARAINYAVEAEMYYQRRLQEGSTQEEAEADRQRHFEVPSNRGGALEEYLAAGAGPVIAKAIKVELFKTNTHPRYCDVQAEVGRRAEQQKEAARRMNIRHVGPYMEYAGDAHSVDELQKEANENLSSRETVDKYIGYFMDAAFTKRWGVETTDTDTLTGTEWSIPKEFTPRHLTTLKHEDMDFDFQRKYYPGVAFIDEPEAGIDVYRHLQLPNSIFSWFPEGSILACPSNSTELYRSNLPRINLVEPEKGIHTPE